MAKIQQLEKNQQKNQLVKVRRSGRSGRSQAEVLGHWLLITTVRGRDGRYVQLTCNRLDVKRLEMSKPDMLPKTGRVQALVEICDVVGSCSHLNSVQTHPIR